MSSYKAPRIIGGIFKFLFTFLIMGICALLVWRVYFSTIIPKEIKHLAANPTLSEAYAAHDGKLTLQYQDQGSITRGKENAGYFSVESCVFIPEARQVQIIFRYNNSTITHLAEDYGLDTVPSKSEQLFDVTILKTTDLTPGDLQDNIKGEGLAEERRQPTSCERAESLLYTYYRYVFDGVTAEELTDGIYVDVYYNQAIDYEAKPYGTLCIYSSDQKWLTYKPSAADRRAMKAAA